MMMLMEVDDDDDVVQVSLLAVVFGLEIFLLEWWISGGAGDFLFLLFLLFTVIFCFGSVVFVIWFEKE